MDNRLQVPSPSLVGTVGVLANMERMPARDSADLRIPLVVGACGHRALRRDDFEALFHVVHDRLLSLMKDHIEVPLIVLSALAEGADRVVARATLTLRDEYPEDVRLVVPLPMRRDIYMRDFDGPDSVKDFCRLLDQADYWFELDLVPGNSEEDIQTSNQRNRQYEAVGQYIVGHCQILLALWDGQDVNTIGGTSSTVQSKLQSASDAGPVHQIVTARADRPEPPNALSVREHYPAMTGRRYYASIFRDIRDYNRYVVASGSPLRSEMAASRRAVLPPAIEQELPPPLHVMLSRYSAADALAVRLSREAIRIQNRIHWLAFAGLACFETFAHGNDLLKVAGVTAGAPTVILRAIFLLAAATSFVWALSLYSTSQPTLDRHQDYRALAEGLRVQFFWRMAGIHDSVSDFYLGKCRTELEWIRHALRSWNIATAPTGDGASLNVVQDCWIRQQLHYFARCEQQRLDERNARFIDWLLKTAVVGALLWLTCQIWPPTGWLMLRAGRFSSVHLFPILTVSTASAAIAWAATRRLRAGAWGKRAARIKDRVGPALSVALAWGCGVLVYELARQTWPADWPERLDVAAAVVVGWSLAGAGLRQHYGEKRAFKEHAKQYRAMRRLFDDGLTRMRDLRNDEQRRAIIRALGRSALEENGDWVMLHRERPLEVPLG